MLAVTTRQPRLATTVMKVAGLWLIVTMVLALFPLYAVDFRDYFLPATKVALAGGNPYSIEGFYNPPWTLLVIAPIAWLPGQMAQAAFLSTALFVTGFALYRLGIKALSATMIMLSLPAISMVAFGNLEWLVLLGLLMPPWLGLFLVLIKPQVGIGVLLYWVIVRWKKDGTRGVIKMLMPVTGALGLSLVAYGLWPLHLLGAAERSTGTGGNVAAFPFLIPFGIWILYRAVMAKKPVDALAAGPCFSPHLMGSSWVGAFLLLADNHMLLGAAVVLSWVFCWR